MLEVTPVGTRLLAAAGGSLREQLAARLESWPDRDVAKLAELLARFNAAS